MQTRVDAKARTARYQWDSLHEMAGWITNTPRKWTSEVSQVTGRATTWDMGATYSDAMDMARNGWNEGAERVQEALRTFTPRSPQPDTRTDIYGFRPHVPRFCAGAPDSMIRHTDRNADSGSERVLTLIIPLFMSASVQAQRAANFGVAVAQYINQLETDGTRVELIACFTQSYHNGWRACQTVTVKNADQPMDLAVVAFAIGHPAMFRRIGFALQERSDTPTETSYGRPNDTKLEDIINAPPGAVIFGGGINAGSEASPTPEAALVYVSKVIDAALQSQEL